MSDKGGLGSGQGPIRSVGSGQGLVSVWSGSGYSLMGVRLVPIEVQSRPCRGPVRVHLGFCLGLVRVQLGSGLGSDRLQYY